MWKKRHGTETLLGGEEERDSTVKRHRIIQHNKLDTSALRILTCDGSFVSLIFQMTVFLVVETLHKIYRFEFEIRWTLSDLYLLRQPKPSGITNYE